MPLRVYVNGTIWFFSVRGDVLAIKAGRKFEISAESDGLRNWSHPCFLKELMMTRN